MLPTSRAFFVSYAGILLAGAIPVPIYPPFRADRIEEYAARQSAILNNAGVVPAAHFSPRRSRSKTAETSRAFAPRRCRCRKTDRSRRHAPPPSRQVQLPLHLSAAERASLTDIALLQYTSGSTGDPKGVSLTHANLLANIRSIGEAIRVGAGRRRRQLAAALSRHGLDWRVAFAAPFRHAAGGNVPTRAFSRVRSAGFGRSTSIAAPSPPLQILRTNFACEKSPTKTSKASI